MPAKLAIAPQPQPGGTQPPALPLSYERHDWLARVRGIEPRSAGLEAAVLLLDDTPGLFDSGCCCSFSSRVLSWRRAEELHPRPLGPICFRDSPGALVRFTLRGWRCGDRTHGLLVVSQALCCLS